jgi:hypothetical protein
MTGRCKTNIRSLDRWAIKYNIFEAALQVRSPSAGF